MSRAYRIHVEETLRKVIRAEDHVSSQLELLEILPAEQMADLLASQLEKQGFERSDSIAAREDDGVKVEVDLTNGEVKVTATAAEEVELKGERSGYAYDDYGPDQNQVERELRKQLIENLEKGTDSETEQLQNAVTDKLEAVLGDLRKDLDLAVNRATAEALKQKAAQLGQIKHVSEDQESGSLTIVIEV